MVHRDATITLRRTRQPSRVVAPPLPKGTSGTYPSDTRKKAPRADKTPGRRQRRAGLASPAGRILPETAPLSTTEGANPEWVGLSSRDPRSLPARTPRGRFRPAKAHSCACGERRPADFLAHSHTQCRSCRNAAKALRQRERAAIRLDLPQCSLNRGGCGLKDTSVKDELCGMCVLEHKRRAVAA